MRNSWRTIMDSYRSTVMESQLRLSRINNKSSSTHSMSSKLQLSIWYQQYAKSLYHTAASSNSFEPSPIPSLPLHLQFQPTISIAFRLSKQSRMMVMFCFLLISMVNALNTIKIESMRAKGAIVLMENQLSLRCKTEIWTKPMRMP